MNFPMAVNNRKGFTLFELLIAMAVLSLVFAFAIPTFRYYQREAIRAGIDGDLRVVSAALKVYYQGNKKYPEEKNYQSELIKAKPQIIEQKLVDPFSDYANTPYPYKLSANGKFYLIYSVGLLGDTQASVTNNGKVIFKKGGPAAEKWISNGKI
jgi:prepilin-type N-terminal cleavage/methylation domain-containing protein